MPPEDPRQWTASDVTAFAASADSHDVADVMRSLLATPDDDALNVLALFLESRHDNTMLKPIPSQMAVRTLLAAGPVGIETLRNALMESRVRYAPNVVAAIFALSRGHGLTNPMSDRVPDDLLDLSLPDGTIEAAYLMISDLVSEALVDSQALHLVSGMLGKLVMQSQLGIDADQSDEAAVGVLGLIADASIRLTPSVLDDFERLIEANALEERYQEFLAEHPVLLDPLAAEMLPKQRLGLEYATDFALRRHDDRWILVEIERPQDRIFTGGNDFTARFNHAFGQVLDFQQWVDENVAYAGRSMSRISAPRGLLVCGLRRDLDERQLGKLKRFVDNSSRIDIVTYDDLLARSRHLYESLRHRRQ